MGDYSANPSEGERDALLERWLREIIAHPLEESEIADMLNPVDPQENPELALRLDPNGVPVWWPARHPRSRVRLSQERRRGFFMAWLGGVWDVRDANVFWAPSYRRRRLAIELLCLLPEIAQAWEQMPWDDNL